MNTHTVRREVFSIVVQKIQKFGLNQKFGLYIMKLGTDGKHYKAKIKWEEINKLAESSEPSIIEIVGMTEKSSLEEAIERVAVPKVIEPLKGKLEATEKHLEDMRKLVFEETKPEIILKVNNSMRPNK